MWLCNAATSFSNAPLRADVAASCTSTRCSSVSRCATKPSAASCPSRAVVARRRAWSSCSRSDNSLSLSGEGVEETTSWSRSMDPSNIISRCSRCSRDTCVAAHRRISSNTRRSLPTTSLLAPASSLFAESSWSCSVTTCSRSSASTSPTSTSGWVQRSASMSSLSLATSLSCRCDTSIACAACHRCLSTSSANSRAVRCASSCSCS
mmetsp:Transcript_63539/g.150542  ORF Transcript_63539/g.150542 Transcript_63539/m.150542 type:complete len:207 (-) Transcript_63539:26-646(-)